MKKIEAYCEMSDGDKLKLLNGRAVVYKEGEAGECCCHCCLEHTDCGLHITGATCEGGYFVDDDSSNELDEKLKILARERVKNFFGDILKGLDTDSEHDRDFVIYVMDSFIESCSEIKKELEKGK